MNKSGSSAKEIGSYIEIIFYKAPKKNRDAVAQNLKKFVPWFEKHGARIEYYQFSGGEATMERIECIDKTFSASEDEDIWAELQYYPDRKHCKDTFAKMMKNQSLKPLGNEFLGLITKESSLVVGGFSRLVK